jgi:hypothetical protein
LQITWDLQRLRLGSCNVNWHFPENEWQKVKILVHSISSEFQEFLSSISFHIFRSPSVLLIPPDYYVVLLPFLRVQLSREKVFWDLYYLKIIWIFVCLSSVFVMARCESAKIKYACVAMTDIDSLALLNFPNQVRQIWRQNGFASL